MIIATYEIDMNIVKTEIYESLYEFTEDFNDLKKDNSSVIIKGIWKI